MFIWFFFFGYVCFMFGLSGVNVFWLLCFIDE